MFLSRILVFPFPYWRMMSFDILPMMLVLTACLLWSPAGYAKKTLYLLLREKLQLSLPQKLPVSYVFIRSVAHYLLVYGIISWCPMYRLLQTSGSANSLLEIQATSTSMYSHSHLGCEHKIWNYEGWNLRPNFITEFIDPVENTGIF